MADIVKMTPAQLVAELEKFSGTLHYYKVTIVHPRVVATDGVKFLIDNAKASWLAETIARALMREEEMFVNEGFSVWTLTVHGNKGLLVADDGNGNVLYIEDCLEIDFPLEKIKLYAGLNEMEDGKNQHVIFVPSEY